MENQFAELTDEQLISKYKKLKKEKYWNNYYVGIVFGAVLYGIINKKILVPAIVAFIAILIAFIFDKKRKGLKSLKDEMKSRNIPTK